MSFEIVSCASESCDGISLVDQTGFFSASRPNGYNAPNATVPTLLVDGTFGYTSYGLQIFYAIAGGYDDTGTANLTVDLLTWPHTVDPDTGFVTWEFTFEELGVTDEILRSGLWLFRFNPVIWNDGSVDIDYSQDDVVGFVGDITKKVDELMIGTDFDCDCEDMSCLKPWEVFAKLMATKRQGCCQNPNAFQRNIDWLYSNYMRCC